MALNEASSEPRPAGAGRDEGSVRSIQRAIHVLTALAEMGAVVLPPNPIDGQEHQIASTQQITALTVTCVGAAVRSGAGILLAAGDSYTWRYYAANFGWYRVRT